MYAMKTSKIVGYRCIEYLLNTLIRFGLYVGDPQSEEKQASECLSGGGG